jgi:hypothetical protein
MFNLKSRNLGALFFACMTFASYPAFANPSEGFGQAADEVNKVNQEIDATNQEGERLINEINKTSPVTIPRIGGSQQPSSSGQRMIEYNPTPQEEKTGTEQIK